MLGVEKPFSQACENNKRPILQQLERAFASRKHILEIGSGTGQHAVFFAEHLPHLMWQTSDQAQYHAGIHAWLSDTNLANIGAPIEFKIGNDSFPAINADGVFSANTAHIMQKEEAKLLMHLVSQHLPKGGVFCQYGPFTQKGQFNSQSNRDFHFSLLERGYGGYRDVDELIAWAPLLSLKRIVDMPANNHLLVWEKK